MSKYRKYAAVLIHKLISPSMRFECKEVAAWLREKLDRACIWRWEITRLHQLEDSPYNILYVGCKAHRELAKIILGVEKVEDETQMGRNQMSQMVFVSAIPIPGALRVPKYLRTIVPLNKPIEEIMAKYDDRLRRSLLKLRPYYRVQQELDTAEIDRIDREMLQPFARARHGSSANLMSSQMVRRFALEFGRLDLVLLGEQVVACMLGNQHIRKGKRYWVANRCGYPETVFSDSKQLGKSNSINHHLAIELANENGFDYCDFALCFARPDDGLIQFKRRWGGELDINGLSSYGYFHIRLPKVGAAQFLWDTPLFAVEDHKLALHLGLPHGPSDDEFETRYRQMGFGGLTKIYLHYARPPGELILTKLSDLYKHQNPRPAVQCIPAA
ncbi:hypothetical protein GALL_179810 [mine drainage metagenome]|uniref:BioF2-like acetyltransferase domain-containing protein n=1 Tax=mine drainage metagenome TaxID=410659 RepID=A0A1J5SIM0_9ZZZZ